jgi:nucleoside phosphorylase
VSTLVFVAAEPRELAGVLRHSKNLCRLPWPVDFARQGVVAGKRSILVANGPGPALAARAVDVAVRSGEVGVLISTGFCGGLDPGLREGDIVVATEVMDLESGAAYRAVTPRTTRRYSRGRVLSQDRVAWTAGEKRRLRDQGGDVVEMEAAAVARQASRLGLPFACVRIVSDAAGEGLPVDLNSLRAGDGRFSRFRVLMAAVKSPVRVLPGLLRLQRRGRRIALVLGDFLAACEF